MKLIITAVFIMICVCSVAQKGGNDSLQAMVIANNHLIMAGSPFKAEISLVQHVDKAYKVYVNDTEMHQEDGVVNYETMPIDLGEYILEGEIKTTVKNVSKTYPFLSYYTVYEPYSVVSADMMNVFYIGVDNPLSVAVPGVLPDKVFVSINNGTLKRMGNSYMVNVSEKGEATISVAVKMDDGSTRSMGSKKFKIRNIPVPAVQLSTLKNCVYVNTQTIGNMNRLFAIPENDFTFEGIKYKVTGFTFGTITKDGYKSVECTGDTLSAEAKGLVNKLEPGDRILIDKIKCAGPGLVDDAEVTPIVLYVK